MNRIKWVKLGGAKNGHSARHVQNLVSMCFGIGAIPQKIRSGKKQNSDPTSWAWGCENIASKPIALKLVSIWFRFGSLSKNNNMDNEWIRAQKGSLLDTKI